MNSDSDSQLLARLRLLDEQALLEAAEAPSLASDPRGLRPAANELYHQGVLGADQIQDWIIDELEGEVAYQSEMRRLLRALREARKKSGHPPRIEDDPYVEMQFQRYLAYKRKNPRATVEQCAAFIGEPYGTLKRWLTRKRQQLDPI